MENETKETDDRLDADSIIEGSRTIRRPREIVNKVKEPSVEPKIEDEKPPKQEERLYETEEIQQMEPAPMPVAIPVPKRQEHREPSGRRRGFPSYREVFVVRNEIKHRQCVYISHEVHSLISSLVRMLVEGGGEITVGGYIDKVLYEHLQAYKDEINELYRNSRPELVK
jgi:hypothetical protein